MTCKKIFRNDVKKMTFVTITAKTPLSIISKIFQE
jgi:hypothetical protein